eukprot:CAMPEP_0172300342 /NCGR_PEP_ID=MMETSP1058-20130122/2449_1 /TAXON_ID=83371 /ORGANISM="Detonula confervacea, Strain CCMP 353" /LENGTH=77 /DNA_ID=CAMNT_0013010087 /DNA_START=30 /DNA_END=263 /DNA_ORIENTATION=-
MNAANFDCDDEEEEEEEERVDNLVDDELNDAMEHDGNEDETVNAVQIPAQVLSSKMLQKLVRMPLNTGLAAHLENLK